MKKIYFPLLTITLLLTFSACKEKNIIFTGVIESVSENQMLVTTSDSVGFDKASVSYDKSLILDFTPKAGQTVSVEILPQIRESYPVQATAVKIALIKDAQEVQYKEITADEAKNIIDTEPNVIILDVRTQEEFAAGHIKDAILIPDYEIETLAPSQLPDKNAKILVYCRTGRRSEIAAKKMIEMGYTDVTDFGGIVDWKYDTTIN